MYSFHPHHIHFVAIFVNGFSHQVEENIKNYRNVHRLKHHPVLHAYLTQIISKELPLKNVMQKTNETKNQTFSIFKKMENILYSEWRCYPISDAYKILHLHFLSVRSYVPTPHNE